LSVHGGRKGGKGKEMATALIYQPRNVRVRTLHDPTTICLEEYIYLYHHGGDNVSEDNFLKPLAVEVDAVHVKFAGRLYHTVTLVL